MKIMSVTTTADIKRDQAKIKISEARKLLAEASDEDTWGFDDFNSNYKQELLKVQLELLILLERL